MAGTMAWLLEGICFKDWVCRKTRDELHKLYGYLESAKKAVCICIKGMVWWERHDVYSTLVPTPPESSCSKWGFIADSEPIPGVTCPDSSHFLISFMIYLPNWMMKCSLGKSARPVTFCTHLISLNCLLFKIHPTLYFSLCYVPEFDETLNSKFSLVTVKLKGQRIMYINHKEMYLPKWGLW